MIGPLLERGADPNLRERDHGQTPLHACATHGHARAARLLVDHGADVHQADAFGNSFADIATAVGSAIAPTELEAVFGWGKRPQRVLPQDSAGRALAAHGSGGWSSEELAGPLSKDRCDCDMLDFAEVADAANDTRVDEFAGRLMNDYIMMNRPVLLRGMMFWFSNAPGSLSLFWRVPQNTTTYLLVCPCGIQRFNES